MILSGYLCAFGYGILCLGAAFLLYKKAGLPKHYTRKFVHILIGFEWVILNIFFGASVHTLAVCLVFTALLLISYLYDAMPMISSDAENAPGTVYYGIAMCVMAMLSLADSRFFFCFGIGVFAVSFGDGFAGVIGRLTGTRAVVLFRGKTLQGTLSNLLVTFVCTWMLARVFSLALAWWMCLSVALLSAGIELVCFAGTDNLLCALCAAGLSYGWMAVPDTVRFCIAPVLLTPLLIVFALRTHALSAGGVLGALAVDLVISAAFGNAGFLLLCLFFFSGVLTDRVHREEKRRLLADREEKGSRRDADQVLSNALAAALSGALYLIWKETWMCAAFVCVMAEAAADTAASGLGVLCGRAYDIFHRRTVCAGESGGMSVPGTASALVFSALLSTVGSVCFGLPVAVFGICLGCAFFGTILDSFLGATLQGKYVCTVCGKNTERRKHCDTSARLVGGIGFITNERVNLICTFITGGTCALLCTFLI